MLESGNNADDAYIHMWRWLASTANFNWFQVPGSAERFVDWNKPMACKASQSGRDRKAALDSAHQTYKEEERKEINNNKKMTKKKMTKKKIKK